MKKAIKKIVAVVTVASLLVCLLPSCAKQEEKNSREKDVHIEGMSEFEDKNNNISTGFDEGSKDEMTNNGEVVTENSTPRLSDECEFLLASGYDADGNFYELVANESEDYSGTIIEIGVIKNDNWSIPLTTDSPFHGDNNLLIINESIEYVQSAGYQAFYYVGAGCFCLLDLPSRGYTVRVIWNGNNSKSFVNERCTIHLTNEYDGNRDFGDYINYEVAIEDNDGIVMVRKDYMLQYLDTNTMQLTEIFSDNNVGNVNPYSEGLFASYKAYFYNDNSKNGFYNIKGERVIDLSKYSICNPDEDFIWETEYDEAGALVFVNGYCYLDIRNDQGTEYRIVIDKTGNVVESVERK